MDRLCPSHVIVDIFCIATLNFEEFCVAEFYIYCLSKQAYIHVAVMVCGRHGFGRHSPPCGRSRTEKKMEEQRVAVVQVTGDEGLDQCLTRIF